MLKLVLLFMSFIICQIPNERLYITIQMMDQVGIIDSETNQIYTIIETEMQDTDDSSIDLISFRINNTDLIHHLNSNI
jgi:hypothetical protein